MGFVTCESRNMDDMDEVDRMNFALAGIARVASTALKDGLASPRGYVSSFPQKILDDIEYWLGDIRKLADEASPDSPHHT